jgi:hypothetical protein
VIRLVDYTYDAYDRWIGKVIDGDDEGTAPAEIKHLLYDGENLILAFDRGNQLEIPAFADLRSQVLGNRIPVGTSNRNTLNSQVDSHEIAATLLGVKG